ncbi:BCCT family transporter [Mitsuokella multacida]|nr:BCCT family transporter [Mitsuokella multacida]
MPSAGSTSSAWPSFTENIGYYLTHIVELSFRTFAYKSTKEEWFTSWTIMYWAWWTTGGIREERDCGAGPQR